MKNSAIETEFTENNQPAPVSQIANIRIQNNSEFNYY